MQEKQQICVRKTSVSEVILNPDAIEMLVSELPQSKDKIKLCIASPPMSGILTTIMAGDGAFGCLDPIVLKGPARYTPRFITTISNDQSPIQMDASIFESVQSKPLILITTRETIGNPEPFEKALLAMLPIGLEVCSDEELLRSCLLARNSSKDAYGGFLRSLSRGFFHPWPWR
jgi:hypothetical protein